MGYRAMTVETLWEIHVRVQAGKPNRQIAKSLGLDKKTVNEYVSKMAGIDGLSEADYIEGLRLLSAIIPTNKKPRPRGSLLEPFEDEIRTLIQGDRELHRQPMKAKTAWEVIRRKHALDGRVSYESFKRFVRERSLSPAPTRFVPRIETEPGEETQIDYGKVGTRLDGTRRRGVQAYCGVLSHSRLPFMCFSYSEDTISFATTTDDMFRFYGGATKFLNLDNLKAGILSASIYDPTLNRTFAELCEHYGVIADPSRPATPKDKGKVERFVQVAREVYRMLDALYPGATLEELNARAQAWCREEYGHRPHGTTGEEPMLVFEGHERERLLPLPEEPYVPARWTRAKVHPDQFIQVARVFYGLPASCIGREVDVRITCSLVTIYYEHKVIRSYALSGKRRYYLPDDFPAYAQPFVPGSYASFLLAKASMQGDQAARLVRMMLETGGKLSLRRAQGCLAVIEEHAGDQRLSHVLGKAIAERVCIPDRLKALFSDEKRQGILEFALSATGAAMVRGPEYYVGTHRS